MPLTLYSDQIFNEFPSSKIIIIKRDSEEIIKGIKKEVTPLDSQESYLIMVNFLIDFQSLFIIVLIIN